MQRPRSREPLGLLIAAARRRIKQAVLAEVTRFGLTPPQFWMLIALREAPGSSQAELAERVRSDPPTVSRTLASLLDRGLVRAEPDPGDRRRTRVLLTEGGERLAGEVAFVAEEVRTTVVAGMSAGEEAAMRRGLKRIIENLDRRIETRPRGGTP